MVLRQYWQLSLALITAAIALLLQVIDQKTANHWLLGIVSLSLLIPLLMNMWEDLRNGKYGIDILAATAIVGSVLLHQYWAAIVIVIMLTGGETLEAYAERRAHAELRALLERAPQQAHILRGRKVIESTAAQVQPSDKLLIKPGETVPVDAIILEGSGLFDESSLSGESAPQTHSEGEQILSGSINTDGIITAKAVHSAADSQYQQIVKLVQNAGAAQAPFVRLADRYSIPFTVTAYVIAIAAYFIGGREAIRFLEVIVVATPCPLLLAAPIALISGMSRASRHGIIVRTGSALEKLAEAETFAFDKTGTLTQGELLVDKVTAVKPYSSNEILGLAASLEQSSGHVLGRAVVAAAHAKGFNFVKAKHVREIPGHGLEAMLQGKNVLVGSWKLLEDNLESLPKSAQIEQTAVYVAVGGQLAGTISFSDELRPETKSMLAGLRKAGIKHVLMITGDTNAAAQNIAKQLKISEVHAEALPADKLHLIEKLKYRPVAFVGDGVNDAPVLTVSDIGIALGARGSTAASESADIVIMRDDISLVGSAVKIAQRTFSIARQSILIGILLSLILMAIFATGHFSPLLGAVLQEVVDVFVIFNALRAHLGKIDA